LDGKTGREIVDFLLECQQEWGMGLIISSHDAYVVNAMEHLFHLHEGRLSTIR
jgi:predicted ABC-type transport system involved in lysophospholipase L1 biosynthesis ATPase subunit